MPLADGQKQAIISQEREKLKRLNALLAEAKSRGLNISDAIKTQRLHWAIDANGYFPKNNGKSFKPVGEQDVFINSRARFSALISSRGGGKSASGAQKALRKIYEGKNGAVLNPDFENFKTSTWAEFREWIPWEMVVPGHRHMRNPEWTPHQPFTLAFLNGVRVICKGLKDPSSARGANVNWLWYDEAGRDRDGMSWKLAVASVRVGFEPQAFITTTPAGKSHWVNEFFMDRKIPEDALKMFKDLDQTRELVEVFWTSMEANKDNLDPGFVASMYAAYPSGYLRDQEVKGLFVDPAGVLGDRSWFDNKILNLPLDYSIFKKRVRFYDLAATEKKLSGKKKRDDPDETVGTLVSWDGNNFFLENQIRGQWEWDDIKTNIKNTAITDGFLVEIWVEQEPAAGGKNQVAELDSFIKREIPGHPGVKGYRPEGDRVILANYWFALAAQGKIFLMAGAWVEPFLDQLSVFPEGKHDDRVTSVSGAMINVAPIIKKWKSVEFLTL